MDRDGRRLPAAEALRAAGLGPAVLEAKEGLALINGTQLTTAIGALALGAVWVSEYLDTSIHGQRELERRGYSVLGSVPQLFPGGRGKRGGDLTSHLITHTDVESSGAEAFRMLRTGLAFANDRRRIKRGGIAPRARINPHEFFDA